MMHPQPTQAPAAAIDRRPAFPTSVLGILDPARDRAATLFTTR